MAVELVVVWSGSMERRGECGTLTSDVLERPGAPFTGETGAQWLGDEPAPGVAGKPENVVDLAERRARSPRLRRHGRLSPFVFGNGRAA